jgi:rRNA maturation endonuclease Nob1
MFVHKCDNCKKEIKQLNEAVVAGIGFPEFSFCEHCGKPIIAFLKKGKLLQPKTTG